jgi:hypothetical protein
MRPLVQAEGHDPPRLIDEHVSREAAMVDDVGVVAEDRSESQLSRMNCQTFSTGLQVTRFTKMPKGPTYRPPPPGATIHATSRLTKMPKGPTYRPPPPGATIHATSRLSSGIEPGFCASLADAAELGLTL